MNSIFCLGSKALDSGYQMGQYGTNMIWKEHNSTNLTKMEKFNYNILRYEIKWDYNDYSGINRICPLVLSNMADSKIHELHIERNGGFSIGLFDYRRTMNL